MLIWLLSTGNFVIGMGAFVVIGLIPLLAVDFGIGSAASGSVLTVYALAYAIGSPLGVALSGRVPRRVLMTGAMSVFGLASLVAAVAPSLEVLLAARVFAAFGAGLFTPVAAAVAASTAAPERRGAALSKVFLGLSLAQVMGVPLGAYLAFAFGWQVAFGLVAALSVPVVLGLWRLIPVDLVFQATGLRSLGAVLMDLRCLTVVSFTVSYLTSAYVVFTYIAPLMVQDMGFDGGQISVMLLVFGVGAVAGSQIGGRLGDRLGPARTLMALAISQVILLPILSLLPLPVPVFWAFTLCWAVTGWAFMAPQQMRLIAAAPERQNVVLALNAAAIYIGAAGGSAIGAVVVGTLGLGALGAVAGALALLSIASLIWAERLDPAASRHRA